MSDVPGKLSHAISGVTLIAAIIAVASVVMATLIPELHFIGQALPLPFLYSPDTNILGLAKPSDGATSLYIAASENIVGVVALGALAAFVSICLVIFPCIRRFHAYVFTRLRDHAWQVSSCTCNLTESVAQEFE